MKRKIGLATTLFLILFVATCATYPEEIARIPGNIRRIVSDCINTISPEEEYRIMSLIRKVAYGRDLSFDFQMYIEGESRQFVGATVSEFVRPSSHMYNPFYIEVVFVHSGAEAAGFPENVIVGWPNPDERISVSAIAQIHREVNRTEDELGLFGEHNRRPVVTLEEFSLTYPITIADLVDNWEKVALLREAVGLMPDFSISW